MHKAPRLQLLVLALLGLLAFAQLPRVLSICLGADGALRAGLSCQCPACGVADAPQAASCGCGDRACMPGGPASPEIDSLTSRECCTGFQLALQPQLLRPGNLAAGLQGPLLQISLQPNCINSALVKADIPGLVNLKPPRIMLAHMVRSVVLRV